MSLGRSAASSGLSSQLSEDISDDEMYSSLSPLPDPLIRNTPRSTLEYTNENDALVLNDVRSWVKNIEQKCEWEAERRYPSFDECKIHNQKSNVRKQFHRKPSPFFSPILYNNIFSDASFNNTEETQNRYPRGTSTKEMLLRERRALMRKRNVLFQNKDLQVEKRSACKIKDNESILLSPTWIEAVKKGITDTPLTSSKEFQISKLSHFTKGSELDHENEISEGKIQMMIFRKKNRLICSTFYHWSKFVKACKNRLSKALSFHHFQLKLKVFCRILNYKRMIEKIEQYAYKTLYIKRVKQPILAWYTYACKLKHKRNNLARVQGIFRLKLRMFQTWKYNCNQSKLERQNTIIRMELKHQRETWNKAIATYKRNTLSKCFLSWTLFTKAIQDEKKFRYSHDRRRMRLNELVDKFPTTKNQNDAEKKRKAIPEEQINKSSPNDSLHTMKGIRKFSSSDYSLIRTKNIDCSKYENGILLSLNENVNGAIIKNPTNITSSTDKKTRQTQDIDTSDYHHGGFLYRMNERRKERKVKREQFFRNKELQQEAKKREMEKVSKEKEFLRQKEEERKEQDQYLALLRLKEEEKEKRKLAQLHYQKSLLYNCSLLPWKHFVYSCRLHLQKAYHFYNDNLMINVIHRWKRYLLIRQEEIRKYEANQLQIAVRMYHFFLMRTSFGKMWENHDWNYRQAYNIYKKYQLTLIRNAFRNWETSFKEFFKNRLQKEVWICKIGARYTKKFYLRRWLAFQKIRTQEKVFEIRAQKVKQKAFSILEEMNSCRYIPGASMMYGRDCIITGNERKENLRRVPLSSRSLNEFKYQMKIEDRGNKVYHLNGREDMHLDFIGKDSPIWNKNESARNFKSPIDKEADYQDRLYVKTGKDDFESELNEIFGEGLYLSNVPSLSNHEEN